MITAPWGTPEYNRQQQEMWNKNAAEERRRQDLANQQMRQRQAEQAARDAANRRNLDTISGIMGNDYPLYGNDDAFQTGRDLVGRDHNGKLPSFGSSENAAFEPVSSGGSVAAAVITFLIVLVTLILVAATG